MKPRYTLAFAILLLVVCGNARAQFCPVNIDFETGGLSNWTYYDGHVSVGPTYTLSTTMPILGKHTLTMGVATDPYGGFPIVCPGGRYSLQLGNDINGSEAQRASYFVHVPSGSGAYSLIYHYAVVFEDPGHMVTEQPRMTVRAYDSATGITIPCDSFCYSASSTLPGFSVSPKTSTTTVLYKPWTSGTLNFQGYGGHTVCVEFTASDCALAGHFGYGYVDMNCGLFASSIISCGSSTATLNGPPGYQHYYWCDSNTMSVVIDTTQNVTISVPPVKTKYALIATPYPGYGCADTLYADVLVKSLCTGTPPVGYAYATRATVCGSPDTLMVTDYSMICGLTFQWQSSNDNKTWSDIPGAAAEIYPYYNPYTSLYYRCVVTCSLSGSSVPSSVVYVPAIAGVGLCAVTDSQSAKCIGAQFYVSACGASTKFNVTTYYGDGTNDNHPLSTTGVRSVNIAHYYDFPGVYSVKQILFDDMLPVDSVSYTYKYSYCHTLPVSLYFDDNGNCLKDVKEHSMFTFQVEVDSNSIPVDTIQTTSGFYYYANGLAGTVYSFKPVRIPVSYAPVCPSVPIVYDTITSMVNGYSEKFIGFHCISGAFDLAEYAYVASGNNGQLIKIFAGNKGCVATPANISVTFSDKYVIDRIEKSGVLLDNTITWNTNFLENEYKTVGAFVKYDSIKGKVPIGDTVNTAVSITPTIGDADVSNNYELKIDTIRGPYDPNGITVDPSSCLSYDMTKKTLKYVIHFENVGNDTAHNVHIMDTLSANIDAKSLSVVMGSSEMYIASMNVNGYNIVKFDFPGINLLDSAHFGENDGMVVFTVETNAPLPEGTAIQNRAGIYFDYNPVVITNTVENTIGCPQLGVQSVNHSVGPDIFPNPATTELTIKADNEQYHLFTITDQLGRTLISKDLSSPSSKIDIRSLPSGIYHIMLIGEKGTTVRKFTKL